MIDLTGNYGTIIAGAAAVASALFAAATWFLSRSQFRLFWPYVDVSYQRLLNGHHIKFSKEGQQRAEWDLTLVSVSGGNCTLARFRTLSFPGQEMGWAGAITPVGRKLDSPSDSFLIVNEEGPLNATLTFTFRAKSRARLRHKIRHKICLRPLPANMDKKSKAPKLFSGEIEIRF